ncbi:uncharacterized protein [Parasteatoda tepidariorum]|uniref:uncharacterized protein n=1 Tax=Parasteatoda tepidariorum TaxID=114398 RepID=UPI001C72798B|nr:delta/omega-plectoxin-Pt1a [Parasteatoda tepidariorum]
MKALVIVLLFMGYVAYIVKADDASQLGPEEKHTLLDEEDDKIFKPNVRQKCARQYEDCSVLDCCNECTRCSCDRNGRNCRCTGKSDLAIFLGLCRG